MCIRERLRAVSTVRQCTVGLARSTVPVPVRFWRFTTIATGPFTLVFASTDQSSYVKHRSLRRRRRGVHYPTHADSMSKILSSRSARLFLCFRKQLNIN
jgi:hypothetical protein